MDLIEITKLISIEINTIREARDSLRKRANEKANTKAEYEKVLAQTIVGLKNGKVYKLDGEDIEYTQASGIERVAKGIAYKESLAADLAETNYKSAIVAISASETIVNALQSVLRVEKYMSANE